MKQLTLDPSFTKMIQTTVIETVQEILNDPEYFCELQPWVIKRLKQKPKRFISFEEMKARYSL